jgi:hypothetical protein
MTSWRGVKRCGVVFVVGLAGAGMARAQVAVDPMALVRRAVQHRLEEDKSYEPLRYVLRKTDARRETVKEIIQTKDGDVARLIEIDGKPLSAKAEQMEMQRLDTLAGNPALQEQRHRSELRDEARVDRLMSMLPEAEIYRFEGMVGCGAGRCYRLSFEPNPRFVPPDIESDILRGFAGEVWIDEAQERLTRLEGHLVSEVHFGFGILGRVDQGGTVEMRQTDVGGHDWELTGLKLNLTGKALMVKPVNVQMEEETSGFAPVAAGIGYRDAIQMLKKR